MNIFYNLGARLCIREPSIFYSCTDLHGNCSAVKRILSVSAVIRKLSVRQLPGRVAQSVGHLTRK